MEISSEEENLDPPLDNEDAENASSSAPKPKKKLAIMEDNIDEDSDVSDLTNEREECNNKAYEIND